MQLPNVNAALQRAGFTSKAMPSFGPLLQEAKYLASCQVPIGQSDAAKQNNASHTAKSPKLETKSERPKEVLKDPVHGNSEPNLDKDIEATLMSLQDW